MKTIQTLSLALCLSLGGGIQSVEAKSNKTDKNHALHDVQAKKDKSHKRKKHKARHAQGIKGGHGLQGRDQKSHTRAALIEHVLQNAKLELAKKELKMAQNKGLPKTVWAPLLGQILLSEHQYQQVLDQVIVNKDANVPLTSQIMVLMLRAEAHKALGQKKEAQKNLLEAMMLDKNLRQSHTDAKHQNDNIVSHSIVDKFLNIDGSRSEGMEALLLAFDAEHAYVEEPYTSLPTKLSENNQDIISFGNAHPLWQQSYQSFEHDDLDEAENKAREALAQYSHPMTHNLIGLILSAKGDKVNAITHFVAANQKDPKFVPSHLNLCDIYLEQNRTDKALITVQKALGAEPHSIRAHHVLAQIYLQKGQLAQSIKAYQQAIDKNPENPEAGLALVQFYLNQDNDRYKNAASELMAQLVQQFPNHPKLLETAALMQLNAQNYAKAQDFYDQLLKLNNDNMDWKLGLARAKMGLGQHKEAALLLDSVLSTPEKLGALQLRIPVALVLKEYDLAQTLILQLLAKTPNDATLFQALGECYLAHAQWTMAVDAYQKAYQLSSQKVTLLGLYKALILNQQFDLAFEKIHQWLKVHQDDIELKQFLASAYEIAQMDLLAIDRFEEIISTDPKNWIALNHLSNLYFESDMQKSLNYANMAFEINPNHPKVLDTLGWILINNGRAQEGVPLVKMALNRTNESNSSNLEMQYHLAIGLYRSGHINTAKQELATLLAGDTQFKSKEAALDLFKGLDG